MVHLSKTAAEIAVCCFKIEGAARHLTEYSTVVFSTECVELGTTEATLALAMNRKPSLLATLDGSWVSQLCADWTRADILRAKPPEFANCPLRPEFCAVGWLAASQHPPPKPPEVGNWRPQGTCALSI